MTLPHFIVIGAMKSGTSSLAEQLSKQTGVFMSTPKEPNFFSDDTVYDKGSDWYSGLFAEAQPGDLCGEASTHYTKRPSYPDTAFRMKALLPDVKLIYVIRNPIDRAVSHYIHEWSEHRVGGDINTATTEHSRMIDYGRYAMQLAPYIEAFGRDAVHLSSLEQLKSDPITEFARIASFLGLPEGAAWQEDLKPSNVSATRIRRFAGLNLITESRVGRALRRTLVPKAVRVWVWNRMTIKGRPELSAALRAKMEAAFLADRAELAALYPDHPALTLCYPFAKT